VWGGNATKRPQDPDRCYLKGATALPHRRAGPSGFVAGYYGGAPPGNTIHRWYNTTRLVALRISLAGVVPSPVPAVSAVTSTYSNGSLSAAALPATATLRTINATCANPKTLWIAMGEPTWPSALQLQQLRAASEVCEETVPLRWETAVAGDGAIATVEVSLAPYAAASLQLAW